eukprot:TRINITY_DN8037_c2_g1_i1.p1 TRINITY_DN8037_c2_g1~~TRINITY_DN8037_c2_g1_i1.p1  ORF type:complete len:251 (-),score=53.10 TRINITY_DN8037_c2_g1_i1:523-1275(-)
MMSNSSDSSMSIGQDVRVRCLMSDRYQQRAFDSNIDPENVKSISMWDGFVVIEENGRTWWSKNINQSLQAYLCRSSKVTAKPEFVALGPNNFFFIKLSDNSVFFDGPPQFNATLRQHLGVRTVEFVAFGRHSWIVKYADGFEWSSDLPKGLEHVLSDENDDRDITFISMGPRDQWFAKFDDGSCKAVIVYAGALREMQEVIEEKGDIAVVALGGQDAYCVLYSLQQDEESIDDSQQQQSIVKAQNYVNAI